MSHSFHQMQFVVEPHLFLFYLHLYVFICICLCLGICLRQVRASTDAIHGGIRKAGPDLTLGAPRIKHSFWSFSSAYLYFHPCSFWYLFCLLYISICRGFETWPFFCTCYGNWRCAPYQSLIWLLFAFFRPGTGVAKSSAAYILALGLFNNFSAWLYIISTLGVPVSNRDLALAAFFRPLVWPGPFNC